MKFSFPKSSSRCQLSGPGSLEQTKDLCRRSRKGTGCVGMLWSIFTHAPFAGTQKKHLGMLHQCLDLPRESPWLSPPFFCRGSLPKIQFQLGGVHLKSYFGINLGILYVYLVSALMESILDASRWHGESTKAVSVRFHLLQVGERESL